MTKYEKYREKISNSIEMIKELNKQSETILKQLQEARKLIKNE